MTDAELQGLCAQALNMAKRDLERDRFNFLLASYHEGAGLHRMTTIEKLIIERLGEEWLNSGRAKDHAFYMLRTATDLLPPDAVIFVTGANQFKPTAALLAMPESSQAELMNQGHDGHHKAVEEGLLEVVDTVLVTGQTPERVCHYVQEVRRDRFVGQPEVRFCQQGDFSGRLKMYGEQYFKVKKS